ncbi:MAG TPA: hypothetical protein VGE02_17855 [Gemmatimonadales bacterium]
MLTPLELQELRRDLADTRVLSVYLDTRITDPAMRDTWRASLQNSIRSARANVADEKDRALFDRAAEHLRDPEHPPGGAWGAPGWVAFATPDGVRYASDLPVRPVTVADWRDGPVIAPYLRVMKQHRPVIVALVESRSARLYRYALGRLEQVDELSAPAEDVAGSERITGSLPRGGPLPAARGAVATDAVQRHRQAAFQRLASSLSERIAQLARDDGWILIGGSSEWARQAGEALPRRFEKRVLVSTALPHDASGNDIKDAAKEAATELRGAHGRVLVKGLIELSGAHARGATGIEAVRRALDARAVDQLLVSPDFIGAHEAEAEELVRAAMGQGADVEIPSGDAAAELDRAASGVAARLRFAIEGRSGGEQEAVAEARG